MMRRLLLVLFMMIYSATSGVAAPLALCQHPDAAAHAAALTSGDVGTARAAHLEESAAAAVEKQGSIVDGAAGALGSAVLPEGPRLAGGHEAVGAWQPGRSAAYRDRALAPLLDPPLL